MFPPHENYPSVKNYPFGIYAGTTTIYFFPREKLPPLKIYYRYFCLLLTRDLLGITKFLV